VYHSAPPPAALEWRQTMCPGFLSRNTTHVSEAARQHCWDHVLMRDEVQHFCEGQACCPKGSLDTLTKVLGPHGMGALLSSTFPRHSWHGQCESLLQGWLLDITPESSHGARHSLRSTSTGGFAHSQTTPHHLGHHNESVIVLMLHCQQRQRAQTHLPARRRHGGRKPWRFQAAWRHGSPGLA